MLVHVVCEFLQFVRSNSQCVSGVLTNGRHNLVVQVSDKLSGFLLNSLRSFAYGFVHSSGRLAHLTIEIIHGVRLLGRKILPVCWIFPLFPDVGSGSNEN
jgi:hypothetical protein